MKRTYEMLFATDLAPHPGDYVPCGTTDINGFTMDREQGGYVEETHGVCNFPVPQTRVTVRCFPTPEEEALQLRVCQGSRGGAGEVNVGGSRCYSLHVFADVSRLSEILQNAKS